MYNIILYLSLPSDVHALFLEEHISELQPLLIDIYC